MDSYESIQLSEAVQDAILYEAPSNSLSWSPISTEERYEMAESGKYDIDFISVTGTLNDLLNNAIIEDHLLCRQSGKIYEKCTLQVCRSNEFKSVLVFAECGDCFIGEQVFLENQENEDDEMAGLLEEGAEFQSKSERLNQRRKQIYLLLNECIKKTLEYVTLKEELLGKFGGLVLTIFKFGQKEPLNLCSDWITQLIENHSLLVNVALAIEIGYCQTAWYVSASSERQQLSECYSFLLSPPAVNILKTKKHNGAHRTIVYNTTQHIKKHNSRYIDWENIARAKNNIDCIKPGKLI